MAPDEGGRPLSALSPQRRSFVLGALSVGAATCAGASWASVMPGAPAAIETRPAAAPSAAQRTSLDAAQARHFRDWMAVLIRAQLEQGPTPRWTHRDCAGLVRFVVAEAMREHTTAWKRSMGLLGQRLPPELNLSEAQAAALRNTWRRVDGSRAAFVGALELVQENTRFVAKNLAQAERGDLLFYDFGDDQHLMVWMGPYVAYHTGRVEPRDSGLRAVRVGDLMAWKDTRWRPASDNPNFAGVYRLALAEAST